MSSVRNKIIDPYISFMFNWSITRKISLSSPHNTKFIFPYLEYLAAVWGSAAGNTIIEGLQISQNILAKVLFDYYYLAPTERLYRKTKLFDIKLYIRQAISALGPT